MLARDLGMTVEELERRMLDRELIMWSRFYQREADEAVENE